MMMRFVAGATIVAGMLGVSAPMWASETEDVNLDEGKVLFQSDATPACAICHALKDADATGGIGPDLDELQPAKDRIIKAMEEGTGPMPSFSDSLSDEQMEAIADYVVHATSQ
ncbi:MAG TPA: cytochrome c [Burkholderiaceae bacterium]|nr:cytochrome c [Burkholderiaceae bacterium]